MDQIVTFSDTDAKALYVACIGAVGTGVTWIEATGHGIAASCLAGASSIIVLLVTYILIRLGAIARGIE